MTTIFRPFSRKRGGKLIFRLGGGRFLPEAKKLGFQKMKDFNADSLFQGNEQSSEVEAREVTASAKWERRGGKVDKSC